MEVREGVCRILNMYGRRRVNDQNVRSVKTSIWTIEKVGDRGPIWLTVHCRWEAWVWVPNECVRCWWYKEGELEGEAVRVPFTNCDCYLLWFGGDCYSFDNSKLMDICRSWNNNKQMGWLTFRARSGGLVEWWLEFDKWKLKDDKGDEGGECG